MRKYFILLLWIIHSLSCSSLNERCSMDEIDIAMEVVKKEYGDIYEAKRGVFTDEDRSFLQTIGIPPLIVYYYAKYPLKESLDGSVTLYSISGIKYELNELWPSEQLKKYNYITFAASGCGDVYCFDLNRISEKGPSIVFATHEENYEGFTHEKLKTYMFPVADSLADFLNMFITEKVPYSDANYDWDKSGID